MTLHDFSDLFAAYPAIIAEMPETFTSHQFIRKLAERNQSEYIKALYSYRRSNRLGQPAPYMVVHSILSRQLRSHEHLVELVTDDYPSVDIFGNANECALWRRLLSI